VKYNKSLTFNCSGIYICTPSETREILSADLLGTRSGTITSEDSTHKLYLVANSLQSGYNRSSIYIRLRKDIYPSKDDILNPRPTAICISFLESLNQIHRETRKKLRQQEQASKKVSHQKNYKVQISILSIEKTKN
jgi:hypothetical protein